jgi:hypothetical protein
LNESPILLNIIIAHSQLNPAKVARRIIANFDVMTPVEEDGVELDPVELEPVESAGNAG